MASEASSSSSTSTTPTTVVEDKKSDVISSSKFGPVVIIDMGTNLTKYGIFGDKEPKYVPSIVGRPKHQGLFGSTGKSSVFVGDEAWNKRGVLTLDCPLEFGKIRKFTELEILYSHIFEKELKIKIEEHPLLLTETGHVPNSDRTSIMKLMFETHRVPAYYVGLQPVLSLYPTNNLTGIGIDVGYSVMQIAPVIEGKVNRQHIWTQQLGGRDLTQSLISSLHSSNIFQATTTAEYEIVKNIKEKIGYVALDYKEELKKFEAKEGKIQQYELPDGQSISVGQEACRAAEALFNPNLLGFSSDGLSREIYKAVGRCDEAIREKLYGNLILSGASTKFSGIEERIIQDVTKDNTNKYTVKINGLDHHIRSYGAWLGGSILSSLSNFVSEYCISKQEFEESGAEVMLTRKCL